MNFNLISDAFSGLKSIGSDILHEIPGMSGPKGIASGITGIAQQINSPSNLLSAIDPTHGLLTHAQKPRNESGEVSKASLKSAGMFPGVALLGQTMNKPKPAGLKNEKKTMLEMNDGGYDGTRQAIKFKQSSKSGTANAIMQTNNNYSLKSIFPRNRLHDMRSLKAPNALDDSLAEMI